MTAWLQNGNLEYGPSKELKPVVKAYGDISKVYKHETELVLCELRSNRNEVARADIALYMTLQDLTLH